MHMYICIFTYVYMLYTILYIYYKSIYVYMQYMLYDIYNSCLYLCISVYLCIY